MIVRLPFPRLLFAAAAVSNSGAPEVERSGSRVGHECFLDAGSRLLFALCFLSGFFQQAAAESGSKICISEFMAVNENGLKDEDGEHSGWIEIYNGSSGTLNLSGWALTTSQTNLTQWRLPGAWLLPEKYLLVFASGKNRATNYLHLHTNFRLNRGGGGYLALVDRATNIVSEFAGYPKQAPDVSYGRVPGDL